MIKLTNLNMVMILVVGCKSGGKVTSSATEKLMMKETLELIFISTRLPPKASSASGKKNYSLLNRERIGPKLVEAALKGEGLSVIASARHIE